VPPDAAPTAFPRPKTARELKEVLEAERRGIPFLLYRDEELQLRQLAMDDARQLVTIGRGPGVDLSLEWDPHVSAVHAEIASLGKEWTIADEGLSRNGTFLNGERLRGRRRLRSDDVIRVGETTLVYRDEPPPTRRTTVTMTAGLEVGRLTEAQQRVLLALCRPYAEKRQFAVPATNQQIADELYLSVEAVKTHLRQLYLRLELDQLPQNEKRIRLAERALELGLVTLSEL